MLLVVVFVVLFREKESLYYEVAGECDCRDAEAGERALEAVPSCEGAGVPPSFTAGCQFSIPLNPGFQCLLSRPRIALCARRGGSELLGIEAGDGGALGESDAARRLARSRNRQCDAHQLLRASNLR